MPSNSHRFPGWLDLKTKASHLQAFVALAFVAATIAAAQDIPLPSPFDEVALKPRVESANDKIFLAPFVNVSFLKAVETDLHELQIMLERGTGIYFDKKTELVWAARDNSRDIDWRRANDYCYGLELAGFDDWRMPSLNELEDLMEPLSNGLYSTPAEISLSSCCVWSSTKKDDASAWNFNYRFSKRFSGSLTHTYDLRALCVRSWSEADGWDPTLDSMTLIP